MITLSHTDKPTRAEAFAMLLAFAESAGPMEPDTLSSLLNFFTIPVPKIAKTAEQWVAKACAGADEQRNQLRGLYVCQGVAFGSDGKRLHRAPTLLPDGYYRPTSLLPIDYHEPYPSAVYELIAKPALSAERTLRLDACPSRLSADNTRICSLVPGGDFKAQYLTDAANGDTTLTYWWCGAGMIHGRSQFGDYLVMGIRDVVPS